MNLQLVWEESRDPHRRGYNYLRVNKIACGNVRYETLYEHHKERPYAISCYLPQSKPFIDHFATVDEAKAALEKIVTTWFERFK